MPRYGLLSLLAIALFCGAASARADVANPAVQFVCTPKINYFSASTLLLDNIDPGRLQRSPELTIMAFGALKQPYRCAWNGGTIEVRSTYFHTAQDTGLCGAVEYGDMDISWNGKRIARIEQDQCGTDRHIVELQDFNYRGAASFPPSRGKPEGINLWIKHCSSTDDQNGTFNCETHYFDGQKIR